MAQRVDVRDGNGNGALEDSLYGAQKDRLKVGLRILKPVLGGKGSNLFRDLGYHAEEMDYLNQMAPFLTLKPASESGNDELIFKASQDDRAYTRNITLSSPQTGFAVADFKRGSGEYRRQHEGENVFDDTGGQPVDRSVARLLILTRQLGDNDEELKKILKNESGTGNTVDSKNPFASLVRAMRLAAIYGFSKDQTGLTSDIKTEMHDPSGKRIRQVWREVTTNPEVVILGRVAHIH